MVIYTPVWVVNPVDDLLLFKCINEISGKYLIASALNNPICLPWASGIWFDCQSLYAVKKGVRGRIPLMGSP